MNQLKFDFFDSVTQFNVAAGAIEPTTQQFNPSLVAFYTGMQCEELAEKLDAIFPLDSDCPHWVADTIRDLNCLGEMLKNRKLDNYVAKADRLSLLDADIDIQVVSEGSILAQGADGDSARREVCRANDDKVVGGRLRRDPTSGKILKPEGWRAPDLTPFVQKGV